MIAPAAVAAAPSPGLAAPVPAVGWDVRSWIYGPRHPFRVNTLYCRTSGAIVTAVGDFVDDAAAAALGAAVRPFESLPGTVVVDVCHAELGDRAVGVVVEAGMRRAATTGGLSVFITHADPVTRMDFVRAGGALLLRPCARCRSEPTRAPAVGLR